MELWFKGEDCMVFRVYESEQNTNVKKYYLICMPTQYSVDMQAGSTD